MCRFSLYWSSFWCTCHTFRCAEFCFQYFNIISTLHQRSNSVIHNLFLPCYRLKKSLLCLLVTPCHRLHICKYIYCHFSTCKGINHRKTVIYKKKYQSLEGKKHKFTFCYLWINSLPVRFTPNPLVGAQFPGWQPLFQLLFLDCSKICSSAGIQ